MEYQAVTREQIIRMALEAQACRSSFNRWAMYDSDLERFAALVAAAERERIKQEEQRCYVQRSAS